MVVPPPEPPEAIGDLPDIEIWLNEPMTPVDVSGDFTGTDLEFSLAPESDPLPSGATISSSGVISGTPVGNDDSVLSIIVRATDPYGQFAESLFDITARVSEAIWTGTPTVSVIPGAEPPEIRSVGTFVNGTGTITPVWPTHEMGDVGVLITYRRGNTEIEDNPSDQGWIHVADSNASTGSGTFPFLSVWVKRAKGSSEDNPNFSVVGTTQRFAGIIVISDSGINEPWDIVGIGQKASGVSVEVEITGGDVPYDNSLILAMCSLRYGPTGGNAVTLVDELLENEDLNDVSTIVVFPTNISDGSIFVASGTKEVAGSIGPTTGELSGADYHQAYITLAVRA